MRVSSIITSKLIIEKILYLSENGFSDFSDMKVKFRKMSNEPHKFVKNKYLSRSLSLAVRLVPGTNRTFFTFRCLEVSLLRASALTIKIIFEKIFPRVFPNIEMHVG